MASWRRLEALHVGHNATSRRALGEMVRSHTTGADKPSARWRVEGLLLAVNLLNDDAEAPAASTAPRCGGVEADGATLWLR